MDNQYLNLRNTFHWTKKEMLTGAGNYADCDITHWMHETNTSVMSGQVESTKKPLESRVYYNYPGQSAPNVIGTSGQTSRTTRILDDGSTQESDATYNSLNKLASNTDATGRSTQYVYASNNIDVTEVHQGAANTLTAKYSYYPNHLIQTATDPSGQATTYTYMPQGQVQTISDSKGNVSHFNYYSSGPSQGYLQSISGPEVNAVTYTWDAFGRVQSVTDINGYTTTYNYDALNRITQISYPDSTYDQWVYTNISLTQTRDRLGRWTQYFYNANQQLIGVLDPADRATSFDRCTCGELKGVTDPLGHRTSWVQDIEGRIITKTYFDNSAINYTYENTTNRLKTVVDAKGQKTTYTYNKDSSLNNIAYTNATIATPSVSFVYDPVYPRVTSMTDGTGTTTYTYNPIVSGTIGSGQLASETGPLGSTATIKYTYDQVGRITATAVNSVSSSIVYDSMDRPTTATNPLGTFTYGYVGVTSRLQSITSTNGPTTNYSYLAANQDFRAGEIQNLTKASVPLSKFDYTYNPVGTIASWQQQQDSGTPTIWNYIYDGVDQLLSAIKTNTSTQAIISSYGYQYDLAGNRTNEQIGMNVVTTAYNSLNQITGTSGAGMMQFSGVLNEPATVTVAGRPAIVNPSNNTFSGFAPVTTGTNTVQIVAKDYSGDTATNTYQIVQPPDIASTVAYDLLGNMINNGNGQTYEWDAKNELTAINYSGSAIQGGITRSEFTYDGLSRRVKIVEKNSSGTILSTKQHLWLGNTIVEERNASNAVQKRFYSQGVQIGTTNYYYTKDHLGSIRELVDSTGAIKARYDYDPNGRTTLIQGTNLADFQYGGYYEHLTSGLNLTKYRAYNPNAARWINRDIIGEKGGLNLYSYCYNDPINSADEFGMDTDWTPSGNNSGGGSSSGNPGDSGNPNPNNGSGCGGTGNPGNPSGGGSGGAGDSGGSGNSSASDAFFGPITFVTGHAGVSDFNTTTPGLGFGSSIPGLGSGGSVPGLGAENSLSATYGGSSGSTTYSSSGGEGFSGGGSSYGGGEASSYGGGSGYGGGGSGYGGGNPAYGPDSMAPPPPGMEYEYISPGVIDTIGDYIHYVLIGSPICLISIQGLSDSDKQGSPGALLAVDYNDDDQDGKFDKDDTTLAIPVSEKTGLVAATLYASATSGTMSLQVDKSIRVWEANSQGNLIPSTLSWPIANNDFPITVYLQGLSTSTAAKLTLTASGSSSDFANVTVTDLQIGVDQNRDGQVQFPSEFSAPNTPSSDITSQNVPYRFWVNDNEDLPRTAYYNKTVTIVEPETVPPDQGQEDCTKDTLVSTRDLEDWTRMWMKSETVQQAIQSGKCTIGLKWTHMNETNPGIKLMQQYDISGGLSYLSQISDAQYQLHHNNGSLLQSARGGNTNVSRSDTDSPTPDFVFPKSFFTSSSQTAPSYLLFEGLNEGKGYLELLILDGTGRNTLCVAGGAWLDIKDIKTMYQRYDSATPPSWTPVTFDPDPNETKNIIVMVHGWDTSADYATFNAEVMFKRLWWQGYKGRLAAFRWPTIWSYGYEFDTPIIESWAYTDILDHVDSFLANYNGSEQIAWHSGANLASFVNSLPSGYRRELVVHSMGNVVAGSALVNGMQISDYVMLNAAMPADFYDDSSILEQPSSHYNYGLPVFGEASPDADLDPITRSLSYRGRLQTYFATHPQTTVLHNFFLSNDAATSGAWELNNYLTKPPFTSSTPALLQDLISLYDYQPNNSNGKKLFHFHLSITPVGPIETVDYFLTDPYEAMPYACHNWGKAAGAESRTGIAPGIITDTIDLNGQGIQFNTTHSAEFSYDIQYTQLFYTDLLKSLNVSTSK